MEESSKNQSIVHLVHGTFARGAEWIHPDSKMANCMKDCLGSETIIEPFHWSGANSHAARQVAGQRLAKKIRDFYHEYPGKQQVIIAHSHGGNVASYALGDRKESSKIAAVICLGTPFIKAHGRDLTGAQRLVQWILIACISVVLIVATALIIQGIKIGFDPEILKNLPSTGPPIPEEFLDSPFFPIYMITVFIFFAGGIGWLFSRPFTWLWRFANRKGLPGLVVRQTEIIKQLDAKFGDTPLLVIDAKGDEAAWWLEFLSRLAAFPYKLWRPSRFMAYGMLVLSGLTGFYLWISMNQSSEGFSFSIFLLLVPVVFFILSTTIVAACGWLFCLIWPAVFRSHALGFGRDDFLKNFIVEIASSEKPDQSVNLYQKIVQVEGKGLHHSRLYQEESVFQIMGEWLKEIPRGTEV